MCYVRSLLKDIKPNPVTISEVLYRFGRVWGTLNPPTSLPQYRMLPVLFFLFTPSHTIPLSSLNVRYFNLITYKICEYGSMHILFNIVIVLWP